MTYGITATQDDLKLEFPRENNKGALKYYVLTSTADIRFQIVGKKTIYDKNCAQFEYCFAGHISYQCSKKETWIMYIQS